MQYLDYGYEQYQVEALGFHSSHVQAAALQQLSGDNEEDDWDEQEFWNEEWDFIHYTQSVQDSHVKVGFEFHSEKVMESHVHSYYFNTELPF